MCSVFFHAEFFHDVQFQVSVHFLAFLTHVDAQETATIRKNFWVCAFAGLSALLANEQLNAIEITAEQGL